MTSGFAKLKRTFVRWAMWLGAFIAFICLCSYMIDAHMRATRASSCEWIVVPSPDNVPYFARWCKLTKDTVLLRLYDAKEQHLLAERTYFQLDRPNLGWAPNYFWYDSYPDDAFITLPPSIFERLRAKLP